MLKRKGLRKHLAATFALLATSPIWGQGIDNKVPAGSTAFKAPQPLWVISATLSFDEQSFYLVDVLSNTVNHYRLNGQLERQYKSSDFQLKDFRPAVIQRYTDPKGVDSYILETGFGRLDWLDPTTFKSRGIQVKLRGIQNEQNLEITGVNTWTVSGDSIFIFGDIETPSGIPFAGYSKISIDDPTTFEVLQEFEFSSTERLRNSLGLSFITPLPKSGASSKATDGIALLLDSDQKLNLRLFGGEGRTATQKLRPIVLPKAMAGNRPWNSWTEETRTLEKFTSLRESSTIEAVHADEESYFLLRRDRQTWKLERLDRATLRSTGSRDLPTSAAHLVFAPSASRMLFIEKGPVIGLGNQRVKSFFWIDPQNYF